MADAYRTRAQLVTAFASGPPPVIDAQDLRDFLLSTILRESGDPATVQEVLDAAAAAVTALINEPDGLAGLDENGDLVLPISSRYDTSTNLASVVLAAGELAIESNTRKVRVGDGSTAGGAYISAGTTGTTGFIEFQLGNLRYLNDDSDMVPVLGPVAAAAADDPGVTYNGSATLEFIEWEAANAKALHGQLILPPDFDGANDVTCNVLTAMSNATDNPTITLRTVWDGGSNIDSTISASQGTTITKRTATVPASSVPDTPTRVHFRLTPGTHASETLRLYGLWFTYTRL